MLLFSRGHFIKSLTATLAGEEGPGTAEERRETGEAMMKRINEYASDETGLQPGSEVWTWAGSNTAKVDNKLEEPGSFRELVAGKGVKPGQRIVYVDGGFDLFSSGHVEFLRQVLKSEEAAGRKNGWYDEQQSQERIRIHGEDFGPAYIIAGVHDDLVINKWKGLNYPIMNIFERGLCVLQCRVSLFPTIEQSESSLTSPVRAFGYLLCSLHAH
jgi:ethanolamine-phosphate cytidylyltransferase